MSKHILYLDPAVLLLHKARTGSKKYLEEAEEAGQSTLFGPRTKVRAHPRKTKSGKVAAVKQHSRKKKLRTDAEKRAAAQPVMAHALPIAQRLQPGDLVDVDVIGTSWAFYGGDPLGPVKATRRYRVLTAIGPPAPNDGGGAGDLRLELEKVSGRGTKRAYLSLRPTYNNSVMVGNRNKEGAPTSAAWVRLREVEADVDEELPPEAPAVDPYADLGDKDLGEAVLEHVKGRAKANAPNEWAYKMWLLFGARADVEEECARAGMERSGITWATRRVEAGADYAAARMAMHEAMLPDVPPAKGLTEAGYREWLETVVPGATVKAEKRQYNGWVVDVRSPSGEQLAHRSGLRRKMDLWPSLVKQVDSERDDRGHATYKPGAGYGFSWHLGRKWWAENAYSTGLEQGGLYPSGRDRQAHLIAQRHRDALEHRALAGAHEALSTETVVEHVRLAQELNAALTGLAKPVKSKRGIEKLLPDGWEVRSSNYGDRHYYFFTATDRNGREHRYEVSGWDTRKSTSRRGPGLTPHQEALARVNSGEAGAFWAKHTAEEALELIKKYPRSYQGLNLPHEPERLRQLRSSYSTLAPSKPDPELVAEGYARWAHQIAKEAGESAPPTGKEREYVLAHKRAGRGGTRIRAGMGKAARFVVSVMRLGEQLGLFGGGTQQVQVRQHARKTKSGVSTVRQHRAERKKAAAAAPGGYKVAAPGSLPIPPIMGGRSVWDPATKSFVDFGAQSGRSAGGGQPADDLLRQWADANQDAFYRELGLADGQPEPVDRVAAKLDDLARRYLENSRHAVPYIAAAEGKWWEPTRRGGKVVWERKTSANTIAMERFETRDLLNHLGWRQNQKRIIVGLAVEAGYHPDGSGSWRAWRTVIRRSFSMPAETLPTSHKAKLAGGTGRKALDQAFQAAGWTSKAGGKNSFWIRPDGLVRLVIPDTNRKEIRWSYYGNNGKYGRPGWETPGSAARATVGSMTGERAADLVARGTRFKGDPAGKKILAERAAKNAPKPAEQVRTVSDGKAIPVGERAKRWSHPVHEYVYVKDSGRGWMNVGAKVGGKRMRWGYNGSRWARGDKPPASVLAELADKGWGGRFGIEPLEKARKTGSKKYLEEAEAAGQGGLFTARKVQVKAHVRKTKSGKVAAVKTHQAARKKAETTLEHTVVGENGWLTGAFWKDGPPPHDRPPWWLLSTRSEDTDPKRTTRAERAGQETAWQGLKKIGKDEWKARIMGALAEIHTQSADGFYPTGNHLMLHMTDRQYSGTEMPDAMHEAMYELIEAKRMWVHPGPAAWRFASDDVEDVYAEWEEGVSVRPEAPAVRVPPEQEKGELHPNWRDRIKGAKTMRVVSPKLSRAAAAELAARSRKEHREGQAVPAFTVRKKGDDYVVMARDPLTRFPQPPAGLEPVTDSTDIEFGPFEMTPSLPEAAGTEFVVGPNHERWRVAAARGEKGQIGNILVGPNGEQLGAREGNKLFLEQGARYMKIEGVYGYSTLAREHVNAPLLPTDPKRREEQMARNARASHNHLMFIADKEKLEKARKPGKDKGKPTRNPKDRESDKVPADDVHDLTPGQHCHYRCPETSKTRDGVYRCGGAKGATIVDLETGKARKVRHGHYVASKVQRPRRGSDAKTR